MCKGILGKKIGMTGLFSPEGKYIPVTVVKLGPCIVTQVKTETIDGYNALQLGFGKKKKSKVNKPRMGHFSKSGDDVFEFLREFDVDNPEEYSLGQTIPLEIFEIGELVNITGYTKGRGFSGVMKRHGFAGGRQSHGSHSKRVPGSIGCSAWPSKVIKGKKLPGRYGNERQTVNNLEVVDLRPEENLVLIKGTVPGHKSGLVLIKKTG